MKIQFISDTHGRHSDVVIEKCDVLVHCGDISNRGTLADFLNFSRWIQKLQLEGLFDHVIYVPGNHDKCLALIEHSCRSQFPSGHILINQELVIDGIKFFGCPYSPRFGNWSFMTGESELDHMLKHVPTDVDVLITHGPPYGILDKTLFSGEHAGSKAFLEHSLRIKPKIHAFGHIHECYGTEQVDDILYVNASMSTLRQHPRDKMNTPIIVEL